MTEQQIEAIPTMSAAEYVVEVFKRTYRAGDAGQWERSDALRDAVEREQGGARPSRAVSGQNDGSRRVIEQFASELHHAGIAEALMVDTLAKYRTVALAWPEEDRFKGASFHAHAELAPRMYDRNRVKIMERLVSRSAHGTVSHLDVRTYKSEMKPKKSTPFPTRVEQHLNRLFKGEMRPAPDATGEWGTVVDALMQALDEARRELANAKERTHG